VNRPIRSPANDPTTTKKVPTIRHRSSLAPRETHAPPKNITAGGIVALATHQSNGGAGVESGLVNGIEPVALWSRHQVNSSRPATKATVSKAVRTTPDVLSKAPSRGSRDLSD
jgi:hypothetical protein